ncbi:MAG: hypothetical protein WCS77_10900 [Elusimicrobiaceae bacterium]
MGTDILIKKIFSGTKFAYIIAFAAVALLAGIAGTETITLKTWYPTPYCSYPKMKVTNSINIGTADKAASVKISGDAVMTGDTALATTAGSQLGVGTAVKAAALGGKAFAANINGYLKTEDTYFKNIGKWASGIGEGSPTIGSSPQALKGSTNKGQMVLPEGKTYTVLIWAFYFCCEDYYTALTLDGTTVRFYRGIEDDKDGCDQNSLFYVARGLSGGTHTLGISRGNQFTFQWLAFPE